MGIGVQENVLRFDFNDLVKKQVVIEKPASLTAYLYDIREAIWWDLVVEINKDLPPKDKLGSGKTAWTFVDDNPLCQGIVQRIHDTMMPLGKGSGLLIYSSSQALKNSIQIWLADTVCDVHFSLLHPQGYAKIAAARRRPA